MIAGGAIREAPNRPIRCGVVMALPFQGFLYSPAMACSSLDMRNRDALFDALGAREVDVAIVGGGITGAGIARDAAMRGLSVALVEAGDFASGTSSRSSKMIHGGLRYLAQGDLALVHEAASERKIVEAIAPHLAVETPFVIPARSGAAIAKLRAGLWTFEKLGGVPKSRAHQVWSVAELGEREPALNTAGLAGAVVYPEYLTNDARLTLANLQSAAEHGGLVVNYARLDRLSGEPLASAEIVDVTDPRRRARLAAKVFVNAAGPWVDGVRALEASDAAPKLALSRGIHIVFPHALAPVERTLIVPAAGRRSIFVVAKGVVTYIGTTDVFHDDVETWPPIELEDVDYLIAAANAALAGRALEPSQISAAWSGVRPLVAEPGKVASETSRRDEIWIGPHGMLSIAGGKLTAYRRMAERVVDRVEAALGGKPGRCQTASEPLPGGEVTPRALRTQLSQEGVNGAAAERLIGLYGGAAPDLVGGAAVEAAHAVLAEGALTLEDYWVRRGGRAWFDADGGLAALEPAAQAMAPLLGWTDDETAAQIGACRQRRSLDLRAAVAQP